MAETDYSFFGDSAADVRRGVTAGITGSLLSGGGSFAFGFNSQVTGSKSVAAYINGSNFAPLRDDSTNATGGSVRGALKRAISPSTTGFATGLFINLQAVTVSDIAYILGLSDSDPHVIALAKTSLSAGLDPTASSILRVSAESFLPDTWHQLRLDSIVNPNGDTILRVFKNDLSVNPSNSPVWESIAGMDDFVDDVLGINAAATGNTTPLAGGYSGMFFQSTAVNARAFLDMLELSRQR